MSIQAKDASILRPNHGGNPGGDRYIYETTHENGVYTLSKTLDLAISGTSSPRPDFHPKEAKGVVIISAATFEVDFISI